MASLLTDALESVEDMHSQALCMLYFVFNGETAVVVEAYWRLMTLTRHVVRISMHRYQLKNIAITAG
jgi:hypothetical protein